MNKPTGIIPDAGRVISITMPCLLFILIIKEQQVQKALGVILIFKLPLNKA